MQNNLEISLLDYLSTKLGCMYLSDLHHLNKQGKNMLIEIIRTTSPDDVSLWDLNDTLEYMRGYKSTSNNKYIVFEELIDSLKCVKKKTGE